MAITYANEAELYLNTIPTQMADGAYHGGRVRVYRATIDFDTQAAGEIILGSIPAGSIFLYGYINTDTSFGGANAISIGDASTEDSADADRYKASGNVTTANAPQFFGRTEGAHEAALTSDRVISLTNAGAMPASGKATIDMVFANG